MILFFSARGVSDEKAETILILLRPPTSHPTATLSCTLRPLFVELWRITARSKHRAGLGCGISGMVVMQGYGFGKSRPGDPQSIQNEAAEATTAAAAVAAATKASATATATSNSLTMFNKSHKHVSRQGGRY